MKCNSKMQLILFILLFNTLQMYRIIDNTLLCSYFYNLKIDEPVYANFFTIGVLSMPCTGTNSLRE